MASKHDEKINVGGKLGKGSQTELCPEGLWIGDDFIDKIPERELSTDEIQHFVEVGADMREREQRGELDFNLGFVSPELEMSVYISPNFKEKSAIIIPGDNFDSEKEHYMHILGFAMAIVKLWDLQRFTIREPLEEGSQRE